MPESSGNVLALSSTWPSGGPEPAVSAVEGEEERIPLAVVVVSYGDPALIARTLDPALDADPSALVVVVDNFSRADHRERVRELAAERGWLLVPAANEGFGAGVNRGLEAAIRRGHRALILLNPDAVAPLPVLQELARQVTADPEVLVSPFMDTSAGHRHYRGTSVNHRTGRMRSVWTEGDTDPEWGNWLSGACLALSDHAAERLGGMSEDYFLYWEDVDVSRRAAARGLRLALRPDLRVVHDEGGTHGRRHSLAKSPLYYRWSIRNRLLFGRRHRRGLAWWRWVAATPRESWMIWLRGGRKQLFTDPRGVLGAGRGLLEGLTLLGRRPGPGPAERRGGLSEDLGADPAPDGAPGERRGTGLSLRIAVPTFRRPAQLARLLAAIPERVQELAATEPELTVDVLVVDNDPEGSASAVVAAAEGPVPLRHVVEATPGIAAVRERALRESGQSDLLVFIDDDEVPRARWLTALLEVWRAHRPAAVAGRVVSLLPEGLDPWIVASGTFRRPERPTGARLDAAATGNLLLDLRRVRAAGIGFDPARGLSGGEDTLFTRRLAAAGETLVWCGESVTEDEVVPERLTRDWALRRAVSTANSTVDTALHLASGGAGRLRVRARYVLGGAARLLAGRGRELLGRATGNLVHEARGARAAARGRGMVSGALGQRVQEYARPD
ncbi:glycosyltransferase family 2 protein [Brachybacterium squillarum]|uniref:glycosyltransferase family 2 protein n=1 Tax=Brachybacterium squillarum TaxID=661979 RepID=UPI0002629762|nr:glycosyltransferase family 2 protein [Brachybacterium squillarum]